MATGTIEGTFYVAGFNVNVKGVCQESNRPKCVFYIFRDILNGIFTNSLHVSLIKY